jgi:hypothetical protein
MALPPIAVDWTMMAGSSGPTGTGSFAPTGGTAPISAKFIAAANVTFLVKFRVGTPMATRVSPAHHVMRPGWR